MHFRNIGGVHVPILCCTMRDSYQVIDDGRVAVLYTVKPYMQQSVGKQVFREAAGCILSFLVHLRCQYIHLSSKKLI